MPNRSTLAPFALGLGAGIALALVFTAARRPRTRRSREESVPRHPPSVRPYCDIVNESSDESFPASDAPAWISSRAREADLAPGRPRRL